MWEDLTKSHLIWIKLIFFFQSASLVVLYPYLVIHMRSLGLSTEEVAVVNGVIPGADMIGPPLAGFLADKIGNFRVFMSGLTFASGPASLLALQLLLRQLQGLPSQLPSSPLGSSPHLPAPDLHRQRGGAGHTGAL